MSSGRFPQSAWLRVAVDLVRSARSSGGWYLVVIVVVSGVAALLASLGQLLPWLIYPAL